VLGVGPHPSGCLAARDRAVPAAVGTGVRRTEARTEARTGARAVTGIDPGVVR